MYNTTTPMRNFRNGIALYIAALLIGLAVRVIALGALPLNDLEARWALQALQVSRGAPVAIGSQPAYVLLTAALFYAFGGAANTLARLIPALAGTALVLVPWLFRDQLKPRTAAILAVFLALEPGLVALSRQAGSPILALTFVLAAWGFYERRSMAWAGVSAGMALLSGGAIWQGLLGLVLAWLIQLPLQRGREAATRMDSPGRAEWIRAGSFAGGTVIVIGSLFFLAPSGLSAWLSGVPEYLAGWLQPSGIPAGLLLFSLPAYQPLGLLLALIAIVRGWIQGSLRVRRLSVWMAVALLLAVFYPAHQVTDLAWMLIPMWALAALELARNMRVPVAERLEVLGAMTLSLLILAFMWLDFVGLIDLPVPSDQAAMRAWLLLGSFLLLVVSVLLVAAGWSIRVARYGAVWGAVAALGIYSFAAIMSAAGLRQMPDVVDMWRPGGSLPQADLLLTTVRQMSDWSDTNPNAQPVSIAGIDSPALLWLLRDRAITVQEAPAPAENSPMLITINKDDAALDSRYRGQNLVWRRTPLWSETNLSQWVDWLTFHQIPQQSEMVILWARGDLFLDARSTP